MIEQTINRRALAARVLAVATTRYDGWAAYIDAVPGQDHDGEWADVLSHGEKLPESMARLLFGYEPYSNLPYCP